MGTLANSFFQLLLSWIRIMSAEIWNAVSSKDGSALFIWISQNWITAAVILCLIGMGVDLIVYLFRWQPYRVWKSSRLPRKMNESKSEISVEESEETGIQTPAFLIQSQSESANEENRMERIGSNTYYDEANETIPERTQSVPLEDSMTEANLKRIYRQERKHAKMYVDSTYDEPEEELSAFDIREQAEISRNNQESSNTEKFEKAIRPRRRRRVREMLTDSREDITPAPEQLIDQNEAYRQPIYPRSWQERESDFK